MERKTDACLHGSGWCDWCQTGGGRASVVPEDQRTIPPLTEEERAELLEPPTA